MGKELDRPVIFLGTGRCGTTIISEIIMRHPYLAYISNYQIWFPSIPQINILRFLFENKLWNFRGQKKQLNQVKILNKLSFYPVENYKWWGWLTRGKMDMSRDFLLDKVAGVEDKKFIRSYFTKLVHYQGKKRLCLKLTGPSRISFIQSIFPDAIFVYVNRKDIPTIKSFLNVPFWKSRGESQLWWKGVYSERELDLVKENKGNGLFLTAVQIKKLKQVFEYEKKAFNPCVIEISYEDFIEDPNKEISKILKFCGLETNSGPCYSYLETLKILDRNRKDDDVISTEDLQLIRNIELDKLKKSK